MNRDIQVKLQEEIDTVADTTGLTYDSIMDMGYLDMVVSGEMKGV